MKKSIAKRKKVFSSKHPESNTPKKTAKTLKSQSSYSPEISDEEIKEESIASLISENEESYNDSDSSIKEKNAQKIPKKPKSMNTQPLNLDELIEFIKENTKSYYRSKVNNNNVMLRNIANFGVKPNQIVKMDRPGEYYGLTIQVLEPLSPLFTHGRVIESLNFLKKGNIPAAINNLSLHEEVKVFGLDILYYALNFWLKLNDIPPFSDFQSYMSENELMDKNPQEFLKFCNRIKKNRHDPLDCRLKVISIGLSKKGFNVVPEEWMNREFPNGEVMHREMDLLDWRLGKPPVVFCVTYGLSIEVENQWVDKQNIETSSLISSGTYIKLEVIDKNKINCSIDELRSTGEIEKWYTALDKSHKILISKDLVLAVQLQHFFYSKEDAHYEKIENCGVMASRLQKCIRRGIGASKILEETIKKMRITPPYNLPELQFFRVNSNRQIFWRLFISCIEDSYPYTKKMESSYLGLNELVVLSLITSLDCELQMNDFLLEKLVLTAKLIQAQKKLFDWRSGSDKKPSSWNFFKNDEKDPFIDVKNAFVLALKTQNMMNNDRTMLQKTYNLLNNCKQNLSNFDPNSISSIKNDENICKEALLSSYDMHCIPNMILILQGSLKCLSEENQYSTQGLSSLIWQISSSYNIRNSSQNSVKNPEILRTLREIQEFYLFNEENRIKNFMGIIESDISLYKFEKFSDFFVEIVQPNPTLEYYSDEILTENDKRVAFLTLFGKKIRFLSQASKGAKGQKFLEGILCGDDQHPVKIKTITANKMVYLNEKPRFLAEIEYIKEFSKQNNHLCENPKPPLGFEWCWGDKKKIEIYVELIESNENLMQNKMKFFANGFEIDAFNAEKVLKPIQKIKPTKSIPKLLLFLIEKALFCKNTSIQGKYTEINGFLLNLVLRGVGLKRFQVNDYRVFDVFEIFRHSGVTTKVWKHVLIKLFTGNKEEILIGPVDRSGKKLQNSISYQYEGVIWRIFNLLSLLYPRAIKTTSDIRFRINKSVPEYLHLYNLLLDLSKEKSTKEKKIENPSNSQNALKSPKIKSHLWEHQESTSKRIFEGLVYLRKKGFGDASCVGSGKTLTALSIIQKIIDHKNSNEINRTHTGFLILLPTQTLFDTWTTEIKKHTVGFEWFIQESNGKISKPLNEINRNTLIISTLGRFRDHPLYVSWQLVVIDECLSVQNREALQTEEAWRQVVISEYGIIMMSATFFRSRFDKMFFMLKMLRSGLPEERDYLDCILNESMICYIKEKTRKWVTNVNRFILPEKLRKGYEEIKSKNISFEKLYKLLENYVYEHFSIMPDLKSLVKTLEKEQEKVLIYAKSKDEADKMAIEIANVSRFPDISGNHVAVAYSEGTYGLNNLVKFTCILTRPPEPDKLPQMKGRLDRPGQLKDNLRLEYFLIGDTIEEGLLVRLEIANKFLNEYIMPLAKFYEIAVGKKN